jgi:hypothetical protein
MKRKKNYMERLDKSPKSKLLKVRIVADGQMKSMLSF